MWTQGANLGWDLRPDLFWHCFALLTGRGGVFIKMPALATGKTRSLAGEPTGSVSCCTSISHQWGAPRTKKVPVTENSRAPSVYVEGGLCTHCKHAESTCLCCGLSFPASTHMPQRKEFSLPQTCWALTTGPSALTCLLSPRELRKQARKRAFIKPITFLLLKQLQKRTAAL